MEKKVYVKHYPRDKREREFRDERPHERHERHERHEKHIHVDFKDDERRRPHFEGRPPFDRPRRPRGPKQKTKMFTSKEDLVAFVNEKGEEGHRIDVYKIEDDLYKVVIKLDPFHVKRDQEEVEIEVEIEEEVE
ncbi:hypothetical protein KQ51_01012 [Candidatus Izimaplasma bacterium HR1]|jgi:hypothetical protein|uniref:hypothetical protein n=1 Tax=Candidatus Izimoplasma sp. HR1 TaxID=1541959 RepID=UPI0004F5F804|nr:hypothetical protein KQ51_01012 [Candidatus Izimaplasma bacterium HR1]